MNAADIRTYLSLKDVVIPNGTSLKDFINDMSPKAQEELLAYATGAHS